jgi:hypothetical protein
MSDLRSPSPYGDEGLVESSGVSPEHSDDEPEILDDIRTLRLKDSRDEVRTLRVGTGKAAGKEYQDTNAYVGFHGDKMVEVYVKKPRGGKWVVIGAALGSLDKRLERESEFRQLSGSDLKALIRKRTMESTSVGGGSGVRRASAQSPETIESSPGPRARAPEVGAGGGVEAWGQGVEARTGEAGAEDAEVNAEVNARGREGRARVLNRHDIEFFPQIFRMRFIDIAAPLVLVGLGMIMAYCSVFLAFLLLHFVY